MRILVHFRVFKKKFFSFLNLFKFALCFGVLVAYLNTLRWGIHVYFKYKSSKSDTNQIQKKENDWKKCNKQNTLYRYELTSTCLNFHSSEYVRLNFTYHTLLEQIWTLVPTLILYTILLPSLTLIYMMDNIFDNTPERSALITLKVIGNQ